MFKKASIIFIIIISICLVLSLRSMQAQKYQEEPAAVYEGLTQMGEKLNKILQVLTEREKADKEILKKLDLVLSNQQKIISELEIVKVRASRR